MLLNKSHAEHSAIAICIQLAGWLAGLSPWLTGALVVGAFLGREIASHEYKEIQRLGGKRAYLPNGFVGLYTHWTADSTLDVLTPLIAASFYAWLLTYY